MAEFHKATSIYKETPVVDYYLDIWKGINIPVSADDETFIITAKYHERPDLLAYDRYGSPRLWWVFAKRNMDILVDPLRDFKSGLEIKIPSVNSIGQFT